MPKPNLATTSRCTPSDTGSTCWNGLTPAMRSALTFICERREQAPNQIGGRLQTDGVIKRASRRGNLALPAISVMRSLVKRGLCTEGRRYGQWAHRFWIPTDAGRQAAGFPITPSEA